MDFRSYLKYKFLNSVFTGLSIGSVFSIYSPLQPSIFSLGGVLLAIGMLLIAKFYKKLINIRIFFLISLFVEVVMLAVITAFLIKPFTYSTALFIYSGYQITFVFGSYLVRTETLLLRKKKLLSILDVYKQSGYLFGLGFSFGFYEFLEYFFKITTNQMQVYYLHFVLLPTEIFIIYYLLKAFGRF
ncbi:hypothetical protein [Sulfurihydrogenibium sp.]|uniref:hypothetical protein n=1 Tax=Sulfurihydrogenibium sp. TaxID=2053621 RepID=UPI002624C219|nr:hypothetical protein [Sulfurihydrogenibium sp.]